MNFHASAVSALPVICAVFISCATTVPVRVVRPAELDLGSAKTIAVLPFQASDSKNYEVTGNSLFDVVNAVNFFISDGDQNETEAASYLTTKVTEGLSDSSYFTLVDESVVKQAIGSGTKPPVDVYLTGKFTKFTYTTTSREQKETVNKKEKTVIYYTRSVNASVTYQLVDSATSRIIAYRSSDLSRSGYEQQDRNLLASPYDIIQDDLASLAREILHKIQPYSETVSISLLSDKSKNPDMKTADELAKQGLIEQSEEKFRDVYEFKGTFEAGYNAAKLLQAEGRLDDAYHLMNELVDNTGDKRAIQGLSQIDYERRQAQRLQNQQAARDGK
jgi:hypothetical protein